MYDTYDAIISTGNIFNRYMNTLLSYTTSISSPDKNWNILKKSMKEFDSIFDSMNFVTITPYNSDKIWINGTKKLFNDNYKGDMLKMFDELMSPYKNGFRLTTDINKIPSDRECWIDGECIMVHQEYMDELFTNTDDNIINKILDIDETDDFQEYVKNVPCNEILYMDDTIRESYMNVLDTYINESKELPKVQKVWKLDESNKTETRNGKYKYFAMKSYIDMLATIRSAFLRKNTVDLEIIGSGYNPYSTFGDIWEFKDHMKYKNLESFSDIKSIEYELDDLEKKRLL
jgi:hypothetical protein